MKIKKYYDNFVIIFELLQDKDELNNEKELIELLQTFTGIVALNKNLPFDDLIKLRQTHTKHLLIDTDAKPFDTLRILIKLLNNFLIITNQHQYFMIDELIYEDKIIIYGSEIYQKDIRNISFSPIARAKWSNPQLMQEIIERN